jgi:hypothetical protein
MELVSYDCSPAADWHGGEVSRRDVAAVGEHGNWRRRIVQPERRLLLGILVDAIVQLDRLAAAPPGRYRQQYREAERWVRSNDRRWPFSFVNVCDALELAYEPLRRALLARAAGSPVGGPDAAVGKALAKTLRRGRRASRTSNAGSADAQSSAATPRA